MGPLPDPTALLPSSLRRPVRRRVKQVTGTARFVADNPALVVDLARGLLPGPLGHGGATGAGAAGGAGPVAVAAAGAPEPAADRPAPAAPEGLDAYPRHASATTTVATSPARTVLLLRDLSRLPDWLVLHAAWRGAPPAGAAEGVTFTQQVSLMGIPADIAWTVTEVADDRLGLVGTGPMDLTLALWVAVAPAGAAGSWVRVDAGVGGDPVAGPMGATVLRSVQESLEGSLVRLGELLADVHATEGDAPVAAGPQAAAPVLHQRTGRLLDPRTPVLVGAGQVVQRVPDLERLADPAALAVQALRRAAADTGLDAEAAEELLAGADAVMAVAPASWTYRDVAGLVADALDADPEETVVSARYGGDAGQVLVNEAGTAIVEGRASVVLVCGAEAGATLAAAQKAGLDPAWPEQGPDEAPDRVVGSEREANNDAETGVGLSVPVYSYALMESALRRKLGLTAEEHRARITGLWSRLSEVAAGNEHAWMPTAQTPERLATVDPDNRMVTTPYPKLLCANLQVDLASGLVLMSAAAAEAAGVPQDRWVFLHAGAAAYDEWFVSERADLAASPAIRTIGRAALEHAGLTIDDVRHVDLYSCFPAAVQIAAAELGLPVDDPDRPLSVTGGLTFAGGPGNGYGAHAVATLVGRLREDPEAFGLSTSLGWFVTKHAVGIYSATPPERPYAALHPVLEPGPKRPVSTSYAGPAVVEAVTVPHDRAGAPEAAVLSLLAPDGTRVLVRSVQPEVVATCVAEDVLGWTVEVTGRDTVEVVARERAELPPPPPMTVLLDKRGEVAVVTINRPERRNAVDLATAELLEQTVDHLEADPATRVVVLTGAGGTFCSGMDLKAAAAGSFAMTEKGGPLGITARPLAKPTIAAVEGHALAGGCELALVADLVVASTASQFGLPEPKRGLVAAAGGVLRLAQRLPRNLAMEMALTGEPQPASRMHELGLVNRLAEPGAVLDAALALAAEITANAPLSVAVSKRIVEESPDWPVGEAFARQSDLAVEAVLSEDAVEGVAAFAEKRAPVWKGR